jgi:hypothetical protein
MTSALRVQPLMAPEPSCNSTTTTTEEQTQETYSSLGVRELLAQAQELYSVKDPTSDRINRIKDSIIARLQAQFDENNQLTLFDNLEGLAFTTAEEPNVIIVQHPDVPLQFRLRKTEVKNWSVFLRTVSQEKNRRSKRLTNLLSFVNPSETIQSEIQTQRTYIEALEWVIAQSEERKAGTRLTGRFVAASHRNTSRGGR